MIKKFALLATVAAIMVGCGGATAENMEAKMKAAADSVQASMAKAAADMEAAAKAQADSIAAAAAVVDSTVDGAVDATKAAADKMTGH
ncbi:MAG: hypothetical protein IPP33_16250 [Flavobacteriales bacterium]|nr:hypothetical protein [Flavobacteriales bacterium]